MEGVKVQLVEESGMHRCEDVCKRGWNEMKGVKV